MRDREFENTIYERGKALEQANQAGSGSGGGSSGNGEGAGCAVVILLVVGGYFLLSGDSDDERQPQRQPQPNQAAAKQDAASDGSVHGRRHLVGEWHVATPAGKEVAKAVFSADGKLIMDYFGENQFWRGTYSYSDRDAVVSYRAPRVHNRVKVTWIDANTVRMELSDTERRKNIWRRVR